MRRFFPFAALLGVALVLGCQDVGTGPDGLVPQFKKDKGCPASGHPSCPPVPPAGTDFTVTIEVFGVSSGTQNVSGPGLLAQGIFVDLTGVPGCTLGNNVKGQLFMPVGDDHTHFSFQFMHRETGTGAESQHTLAMLGELPDGDLPPDPGKSTDITEKDKEPWSITSKGKNHKNGCKTEDVQGSFMVTFAQP